MSRETKDPVPQVELPEEVRTALANHQIPADFFDANPDKIISGALNNFHAVMPGGRKRKLLADVFAVNPNHHEKPLRQKGASEADGYSGKRLGETLRDFFTVVDGAAKEIDIDLAEIERLNEAADALWNQGKEDEAIQTQEQIREKLIPLYKKLRELGYSHYDLVV